MRVVVGVVVAMLLLAAAAMLLIWGTADQGAPTPAPATSGPTGSVPVTSSVDNPPVVQTARILVSVPFRTGPGDQAPVVTDEFGENEVLAPIGRRVTVLERRVATSSEWARVYVHTDPNEWPGDFFAWLPVFGEHGPILELEAVRPCPAALTLESISALSPFERVACAADRPIILDVRTGFPTDYVAYRAEPAFFGSVDTDTDSRSLAPVTDKLILSPAGAGLPTFDAFVAPGGDAPPIDFDVRVTGAFANAASAECRRTKDGPAAGPAAGLPDEQAADSVAWCRGLRSLLLFPDTVRYRSLPGPSLVTGTGLVLRDGATFDPDTGFPGLPTCPGGLVISFGF